MRKFVGLALLLLVVAVLGIALAISGMPLERDQGVASIGQCEGVCPGCSVECEAPVSDVAEVEVLGAETLVIIFNGTLDATCIESQRWSESARVLKFPRYWAGLGAAGEHSVVMVRGSGSGRYSGGGI